MKTEQCKHPKPELTGKTTKRKCNRAPLGILIVPVFRCPDCGAEFTAAAKSLGIKSSYIKSASCQQVYVWAKANKLILEHPEANCVFLQYHPELHPELHRYAHTGLVSSYNPKTNTFITVEGSSNDEGSREGYEVCSNTRLNTPCKYVFVRIV